MKYKLKKIYPGSPKLGTICEYNGNVWSDSNEFTNPIINPEEYPEFWQKVIEKDYEILSLVASSNVHSIPLRVLNKNTNLFGYAIHTQREELSLNFLLNSGYVIHSIKRLSDGEIFTIGDLIGNAYPISEFEIYNKENTVLINCYLSKNSAGSYNQRLKTLKKPKQKLFTTEDCVDIFEGDIFWNVGITYNLNDYQITNNKYNLVFLKDGSKQFSTKEKAEEYILMNKPILSLNEIYNLTDKESGLYNESDLEKLVKQKINNKN